MGSRRILVIVLTWSWAVTAVAQSLGGGSASAAWVPIQGNVRLADGTPICAMVLANGQYMFSCDGTGAYSLAVPLDANGEITLFAFADGFAPFRVTTGPTSFPLDVRMHTSAPTSPLISTSREAACSGTNRVRVSGDVETYGGHPLCAMILANGQHLFSCDASLGQYSLDVPVDENGNVTVFAFADGFQPYSDTFVAPDCRYAISTVVSGVEILANIVGEHFYFSDSCWVKVYANNTANKLKDVRVFFDAWDRSGEPLGAPPLSFYLRAGVMDIGDTWISYRDRRDLPCDNIARWEIDVYVEDVVF